MTSAYHERGGEPGTPEFAKRPVRNCCTILRHRDKYKYVWVNVIDKSKICMDSL